MREITVKRYEAFDGAQFDTAEACRVHETSHAALSKRLSGKTEDQIERALTREDEELADVIERAGIAIRNLRRKAGDLKRPPRRPRTEAEQMTAIGTADA